MTDTHWRGSSLQIPVLQRVRQGDRNSKSGHSQGMPQSDRAAIDIEPAGVDAKFPLAGQNLHCKGFIHLK